MEIINPQGKGKRDIEFSFIINAYHDINFQPFTSSSETNSWINQPVNITGAIKRLKVDCLVIFNDFSKRANGKKRGLYADCVTNYPNNFLQVFDRWGVLVFEIENYGNSWTGKRHPKFTRFGREELIEGTYFYVSSFPE